LNMQQSFEKLYELVEEIKEILVKIGMEEK
jgi:hypothetical protein